MSPDIDEDDKILPFPPPRPRGWRPGHVPKRLLEDLLTKTPPPTPRRKVG